MDTKRTTAAIALVLAMTGLGSGCSTWFSNDFESPQVELVNAEVVHARLLEQQFKLHFRIDNPNQHSLPVRGIEYQVELNGIPLGKGTSNRLASIPANGHSYYEIPIYTNIWRQIRNLVRMLESPDQQVDYSLQVRIKTGLFYKKYVELSRRGYITPGDYLKD